MWTVDTLRQLIADRGETGPRSREWELALLAHERWRGRTDERYPRDKARMELEVALGRVTNIPPHTANEYKGMTQLRAFARDLEIQKEKEQRQALPLGKSAAHAGRPSDRDMDRER